jgi:hypothetical protein
MDTLASCAWASEALPTSAKVATALKTVFRDFFMVLLQQTNWE